MRERNLLADSRIDLPPEVGAPSFPPVDAGVTAAGVDEAGGAEVCTGAGVTLTGVTETGDAGAWYSSFWGTGATNRSGAATGVTEGVATAGGLLPYTVATKISSISTSPPTVEVKTSAGA